MADILGQHGVRPASSLGGVGPDAIQFGSGNAALDEFLEGGLATGAVSISGREVLGHPTYMRASLGVGFVPEGRGVFGPLSVRENLLLGGYCIDAKLHAKRLDVVCELFPVLGRRFEQHASSLSGGEQQMLAVGRALMSDPTVLICDEPVASLDVSIQAQIINLFLKLKHELNLTMLFISHDLGVIRHITDNIAVMYLGRIVERGPTLQVYENPRHPYTRALLDSIPRLVTEGDELVTFKAIEGELPSPLAPPPGCHFHLRCPFAQEVCKSSVPDLTNAPSLQDQDRHVACHFPIG